MFPLPAVERMMWTLSEADLVAQRQLYPADVGLLLREKRLARKAAAQWKHFALVGRLRRDVQSIDTTLMGAQIRDSLGPTMPHGVRAIVNAFGTNLTNAPLEESVKQFVATDAMQEIAEAMGPLLEGDAQFASASEAYRRQEGSLGDVLQVLLQGDLFGRLFGAIQAAAEAQAPRLVRVSSVSSVSSVTPNAEADAWVPPDAPLLPLPHLAPMPDALVARIVNGHPLLQQALPSADADDLPPADQ